MKAFCISLILSVLSIFSFGQFGESTKNYDLGNQYFGRKDYKKAIEYYTLSLEVYPAADAFFNRALSYKRLNDTCRYCKDLDASIRFFDDKEAAGLFYKHCAKRDSIIEKSDLIRKEYTGYRYTIVTKHKCDNEIFRSYFDKHDEEIWSITDQLPEFPGGEQALKAYLSGSLKYPASAKAKGLSGTVFASFVVRSDGSMARIKIDKGIGAGCDEESVRLLQLMPKWKPGTKNGDPVNSSFSAQIQFTLSDTRQTGVQVSFGKAALPKEKGNHPQPVIYMYKNRIQDLHTAEMLLDKGNEALTLREYEKAISLYTNSILKFPLTNTFFNRALAYSALGDSCHFCQDMKDAGHYGDPEALGRFNDKCTRKVINYELPDSILTKIPGTKYLETRYENFGKDSAVYVVYSEEGETRETNIIDIDIIDTFIIVEEMPEFPGGDNALYGYLMTSPQYPKEAKAKHIKGDVYVSFVVEKDGTVANARIIQKLDESCDKEALRVIQSMPKWNPGKQGGNPVRVRYIVYIHFP